MEIDEKKEIITQIDKITMEVTTNYGHREITVDEVDPPLIGVNCVREYKDHLKHGVRVGQELDTKFTNIIFDTKQLKIGELKADEPKANEQMLLKLNYLCRMLNSYISFDICIGSCAYFHTNEEPYIFDGILFLEDDEERCSVQLSDVIDFDIAKESGDGLTITIMSQSLGEVVIRANGSVADMLLELGY